MAETLKEYKADAGKVWYSLINDIYLSDVLILGCEDDISNYEQRTKPVIEE